MPSATTRPALRIRLRLSPYAAAPPPVAITAPSSPPADAAIASASAAASRRRNPGSSRATSWATGTPPCAITSSRSTNRRPVAVAIALPTDVLPAAMNPIRNSGATGRYYDSLAGQQGAVGDPRRDEHQDLGAIVVLAPVLEQPPDHRDVAEQRELL